MSKTKKDILKVLKQCAINIGKERDKLQKEYEELLDILDNTNEGLEDLEAAIYHFSEKC